MRKLGRNDSCPCGSGLKYKKCCMSKDEAANVTRISRSEAEGDSPSSSPSLRHNIEEELEWPNELHKLIALHFYDKTKDAYPEEMIMPMLAIWHRYANVKTPVVKKIGVFPAALEYLLCNSFDFETTQKELAEKYNVTLAALSQRLNQLYLFMDDQFQQMEQEMQLEGMEQPPEIMQRAAALNPNAHMAMEKQMAELHALLEEQQFESIEEANAFLAKHVNSPPGQAQRAGGRSRQRSRVSNEQRASDLIYQAWEETNPQRRVKLAQNALALEPSSGDAYNILAETAETMKETAYFYKKGMEVEEKRLGKAFFEENKGHFWGLLPTRPYMRARKGYAETCAELDKLPEAITHFRELLELNPNDNQGVRYLLVTAYLETEDWAGAEQLFEQYEEGTAHFNYSRVLTAYVRNGKSARLTELIKQAIAQNPYVPAYLQGKKRLPRTMPAYMGFGDEQEAVVYAITNGHLWRARPEILRLLR